MSDSRMLAQSSVPRFVPFLNALVRRLMGAGLPFGPNVLLTVRGRKSGLDRTFPVALMETGGRLYVQSPYGEVNWVRNLRASGDAVLTRDRRRIPVAAVELEPEQGGRVIREAVAPFLRGRLTAAFMHVFVPLRRDATVEEYVEHVRRHPVFELRPLTDTGH
jgi:deazaflavin-dependent oxidoreductase (nitroreductase family)